MNSLHDSVTLFQTLSIGPTPLNLQQFKVAEQQYNQLKLNPQNFIYLHVSVLQQSDSSAIRKYVITQLYTHVIRGRNAMYITLQPNIRDELNKLLLVLMDKETDKLTLHGYQNAIAICCSQLASLKIFWDGALNACFQWISGSNILLQTHAISLLSDIVLYLTDEQFKLYYQKLIEIIPLGLNSQEPLIIVNSVALFKSVLENCDDGEQVMTVTNFFPLIISNANKFMQTPNSDDHQQSILESIEELFEEVNYHLEEYVPVTLQLCFQICVTDKIDFEVQSTAFEVILTIADELPKTLKKNKEIQTIFLQIILKYLQTIGDSPAWFKSEEESDDFPYFYLASEGFSRFITSVGCSSILNNIIQNSQQLTSSPKWSDRLSLLICFTTILSDCKHTMKKYIKQVMEIVLKFQQDPYPRVRHQLIIFNNKLLVSYPKDKQSYLSIFLQIIYSGLSDEIPRIQSRSCDFLSNLVDLFPAKSIKDQFQPMLQKIQPLLMSSDINVIAESLCSLSYINTKMKYDFLPYFNDFYPILEKILLITNNYEQYFEIKGRAIECLSIIGMYLKGDYCIKCTQLIINELDRIIKIPNLQFDNSLFGFVETSCTRLAEILQEKFAPFLPTVVQIILERVKLSVVSDEYDDGCEQKIINDTLVNVHTARSEEKRNAIVAIGDFANDLGLIFLPYVIQSFQIIAPLIKDPYDENIRDSAADCSFKLLNCYYKGKCSELNNEEYAKQHVMNDYLNFVKDLCDAICHERYVETIVVQLKVLTRCVDMMGLNSLPLPSLQQVFGVFRVILGDFIKRMEKEFKLEQHQDEEERKRNEEQNLVEGQLKICYRLLLATVCDNHQTTFYPVFDQLLLPLIKSTFSTPKLPIKITTFSHIILTTVCVDGKQYQMVPDLIPMIMSSTETNTQQFSCLANLTLLVTVPQSKTFIPQIYQLVQQFIQLKDTNFDLFEMALICLGRCLVHHQELFEQNLPLQWLNLLTIKKHPEDLLSPFVSIITKSVLLLLASVVDQNAVSALSVNTLHSIINHYNDWKSSSPQNISEIWLQIGLDETEVMSCFYERLK